MSNKFLNQLLEDIKDYQSELHKHVVYQQIKHPKDLAVFMEHHVFAVWDFMSLAKALQRNLTSVDLPWQPNPSFCKRNSYS